MRYLSQTKETLLVSVSYEEVLIAEKKGKKKQRKKYKKRHEEVLCKTGLHNQFHLTTTGKAYVELAEEGNAEKRRPRALY